WEINKTTNRSEFEKIGETSSSPALGRLRINGSASDPYVAIIGSGFDPYDIKNLSKTAYLTVVDLKDGSIIKQIEVSSKLGNITTNLALLRDKAGYLEKIYFGDYYGCLWRINLSTTTEVNDFLGKTILAEEDMLFKPSDYASSDMLLGPEPERPISAPPILGMAEEETIWAYFGTGSYDDYDPGYPYQKFYGLKDVLTTPYQDGGLIDMTNSSNTNLDQDSWHITLGTNDNRDYDQEIGQASVKDRNERVLTTPEVYGGFVFFTTWTPNDDPCGGGVTRFYSVGYKSGGYEGGLIKGVEDAGTEKTDVRSIIPSDPSAKSSVPSKPMIYVGQSESGEPVAKGLVNLGTGELTEIELDPSKFAEILNILLWREIK
ncbi:hypothetical protein KKH50_04815, partial [Patescibacteria group bacterium]|nr:hypothetical protein [Patescibacteria group bacterium]